MWSGRPRFKCRRRHVFWDGELSWSHIVCFNTCLTSKKKSKKHQPPHPKALCALYEIPLVFLCSSMTLFFQIKCVNKKWKRLETKSCYCFHHSFNPSTLIFFVFEDSKNKFCLLVIKKLEYFLFILSPFWIIIVKFYKTKPSLVTI